MKLDPKTIAKRGYEMNRWRFLFATILMMTLCACAAQQGGVKAPVAGTDETPSTVAPTEVVAPAEKSPTIAVPDLPCAEVVKTDGVTIRYPGETIYGNGAALPREEGLVCLNVLTDWLKSVPQSRWQVTLAGEEGSGFDPKALGGKRKELLQRFFTRKGIESQTEEWQATAEQGVQLQLRLLANES